LNLIKVTQLLKAFIIAIQLKQTKKNTMKNKLQILTIALVTLIFTNGYSATRTWDGSSSGDWNTGANWSSNSVPNSGDNVIIPAGLTTTYPTTNITGTYVNFTLNANTLTLTGNLTVTGTLTVNGSSTILNLNGFTLTTTTPTLTNSGTITSTNSASILSITGTFTTGTLFTLTAGSIQYNNLTITADRSLSNNTTVTGTLTLNNSGTDLNLNGFTLTTTTPTLSSGTAIISTNAASKLSITSNSTTLYTLGSGTIQYVNLTISSDRTLSNDVTVTNTLTVSGSGNDLNLNGKTLTTNALTLSSGGNVVSTNASSILIVTNATNLYTLSSGTIQYVNLTLSSDKTLSSNLTVSGTLTLNNSGTELDLNGFTLTTAAPTLSSGTSLKSTNNASVLSITGTFSAGTLFTLSNGTIKYDNLTISSDKSLSNTTIVTGTLTVTGTGTELDLNGKTLTTAAPTLSSGGALKSTNSSSKLIITGSYSGTLYTFSSGTIEYNNLTTTTNQSLPTTTIVTGTLTVNGGTLSINSKTLTVNNVTLTSGTLALGGTDITWNGTLSLGGGTLSLGGAEQTIAGDITVTAASTIISTSVSRLNSTGKNLTINGGGLLLNNVELVTDNLTFQSSHDITASNGGFLAFDNSTGHTLTGVGNASHVNAKVRLYLTRNGILSQGNYNSFDFPIGDGTVYAPFIYDPSSVTGFSTFNYWVEATYTGAKASTTSINPGTGAETIVTVSGYEYWTAASSGTSGKISLRYDANVSNKTGKSLIGNVTDIDSDLKLTSYDNGTSKWVGVPSGNATSSSITVSSANSNLTPNTTYTLASGDIRTTFMAPLPVTLMNFDAVASKNKKSVEVRWATASEENNSHFEIMHSTDFVNWTSIGTVYSKGNGNGNDMNVYTFTDINPNSSNNYKLKIVAFNGEVSYSDIKLVKFTETVSTTVKVYPNPANANVNLSIDNMDMSTPVSIQLLDQMGQIVFEQIITENYSGMMKTTIPTSEFAAGIYQISISGSTGTVTQKLIINH